MEPTTVPDSAFVRAVIASLVFAGLVVVGICATWYTFLV